MARQVIQLATLETAMLARINSKGGNDLMADKKLVELLIVIERLNPTNRKAVLARAKRLLKQQNKKAAK